MASLIQGGKLTTRKGGSKDRRQSTTRSEQSVEIGIWRKNWRDEIIRTFQRPKPPRPTLRESKARKGREGRGSSEVGMRSPSKGHFCMYIRNRKARTARHFNFLGEP